MTKKQRALLAVEALKKEYPEAICSLTYTDPLQLLIATRLSAQCTDARVNLVTPALFERFPTLDAFCDGSEEEIAELIRSCGLYKTKAKDIFKMCHVLRDTYNGVIPDTVEELTKLPGVGRKTANLVVGDIYKKPAVVTDTHCIRIAGRLGLTESTVPLKVEKDLRAVLPPEESNDFCHRTVLHGRAVCSARSPKCAICCMRAFCKNPVKDTEKESKSMKRVLLTSAGLTDSLKTLFFAQIGKPAEKLRVLYIPTAGAIDDDEAREGIALCIAELLKMGVREDAIFPYHINCILSDGYDKPYLPDVPPLYRRMTAEELLRFDLVLVGGGNASFLMKELRRTGLDALLKEAVEDGLFYLGVSAGSMVAAGNFSDGLCWIENPIIPHSPVGTPCGALPKDDTIYLTNEQAVWLCGDTAQIL